MAFLDFLCEESPFRFVGRGNPSPPGIFIALRCVLAIAFITLSHCYFLRHRSLHEDRKKLPFFSLLDKLQQCSRSRVSINVYDRNDYMVGFHIFRPLDFGWHFIFFQSLGFSSPEKTALMVFTSTFCFRQLNCSLKLHGWNL